MPSQIPGWGMGDFFAELKRRHIYRVAAAYAVVAWMLLQVVNNVAPVLDLPPWVARASLLFLSIGFPLAILFAWMRELPGTTDSLQKATITDLALIGVLVLVLGAVSYQQFAPSRATVNTPSHSGFETAGAAPNSPGTAISIAVLPFTNLSGDPSQEFFSDGMTEEITAALAKIPDLRVVARTSAFEFKDENRNIQAIADTLHATHLIEGSVRKAGDRVRITAQLIKADDGTHVWAENYDREMTDIFSVQEDIARAITASLRVQLGLGPGQNLVNNRTIDPEDYQQFLRAKALVRSRESRQLTEADHLLAEVVDRNANYAPAWALLAQANAYIPLYSRALEKTGSVEELRLIVEASFPKAEAAANRAIELDPNSSDGYMSLATAQQFRGKFLAAEESYLKSLSLDPNNPDTLNQYSYQLAEVGRLEEALAMRQRLQALEPFVPAFNDAVPEFLWLNGQTEAAIAAYRMMPPDRRGTGLARAYAASGQYAEAAEALVGLSSERYPPAQVNQAVRLLRAAPAKTDVLQGLPRSSVLNFVYLYVGAPERTLDFPESEVEAGFHGGAIRWFWHPIYAPVRKSERFKALMRKIGLVDYWRERGWPQLCRPTTGDYFECY